ncbi:MAG: pantetheine-phosphate adenylyltransferase [Candidatus Baltobacteraceae bacterium]
MAERPDEKQAHAVYPGSFDPPTNGHLDVIARAAAIFPRLTVAVVVNPQKRDPLFAVEEREAMLRECTARFPNVRVEAFRGLLADFARARGADVIVKGLRVVSDFESEMAYAHMNRALSGVDTMFLMAHESYSFVSSSLVKEVFLQNGDVSPFVPPTVLRHLRSKHEYTGGLHVDLPRHR